MQGLSHVGLCLCVGCISGDLVISSVYPFLVMDDPIQAMYWEGVPFVGDWS